MDAVKPPLKIDCSIYKDICQAPVFLDYVKHDLAIFDMQKMLWLQSDELTHLRCLFDLSVSVGITVQVLPPANQKALIYAQGMGLFKGFNIPGVPFPNGKTSNYIPLTKVTSDKNGFLFEEFQKIFEKMHLSGSVIPSLCLAFTEIADNIFYHSGWADNKGWGYLAAQVYRNRVQISFTDAGGGFEKAYERSGTKRGRTNLELIKDSLNYLESRFNIPGQRATRGIGLHEACNLARTTGGQLVLRSAADMVSLSGQSPIKGVTTSWVFCGSQVSMDIPI